MFQDKIDGEKVGSEPQEAIAEGLLDLSILDKAPEINRGTLAGSRYYNSKHEDISRGSMNTEAWHGKIMGLGGGLRARASTKMGNSNNAPAEGNNTTADGNASSNAEDATTEQKTPNQAAYQADEGGVQEE